MCVIDAGISHLKLLLRQSSRHGLVSVPLSRAKVPRSGVCIERKLSFVEQLD